MSRLFRISPPCYDRLLAVAAEGERFRAILERGVIVPGKVEIVCNDADAEILLKAIVVVCPEEAITEAD
jgi:hypothetical protein